MFSRFESVLDRRGCTVAKLEEMPGQDFGEVKANARLIAAAPEMAEALAALVDTRHALCPVDHPALAAARAALTKAGIL